MAYKRLNHSIQNEILFIYKIKTATYEQRLFNILDQEHPYVLRIVSKEINKSLDTKKEFEKIYNFNFIYKDEGQYHLNQIYRKKKIVDDMLKIRKSIK